jgi:hypothetical protein
VNPLDKCRTNLTVVWQAADGAFELDSRLASVLGLSLPALQAAQARVAASGGPLDGLDAVVAARAWATSLVLAALERTFASMRDSWALFAKRSAQWLRRALGGAAAASKLAELTAAAQAAVTGSSGSS